MRVTVAAGLQPAKINLRRNLKSCGYTKESKKGILFSE